MLIYGIVQGFHFFNTREAQIEAVLIWEPGRKCGYFHTAPWVGNWASIHSPDRRPLKMDTA